jgi:hypothetical protein
MDTPPTPHSETIEEVLARRVADVPNSQGFRNGPNIMPPEQIKDTRSPDTQNVQKQANKGYDIPLTGQGTKEGEGQ